MLYITLSADGAEKNENTVSTCPVTPIELPAPLADKIALVKLYMPYDESAMQAYTVDPGFLKMNPHDLKILEKRT